jgi:hypothetical protein
MEKLAKAGIPAATCLMPVLPKVCDSDAHLSLVVGKTADDGVQFVLAGDLTLPDRQRVYFSGALKPVPRSGMPLPEIPPQRAAMVRLGPSVDSIAEERLFLSAISTGEIKKGVEQLPDSGRKSALTEWLEDDLPIGFRDKNWPVDMHGMLT